MVENLQQDQLRLLHREVQKNLPEKAQSIFDCGKIFILFHNAGSHYTFYTIFVKEKFIGYYDSDKPNKNPPDFPLELIYTWLQYEHEALQRSFHRMDWTFQVVEVKRQGDNVDCGFHAIRNTLLLQMDFPLLEYEVFSYNTLPHNYARKYANIMF
jgi:Ulp1 family protease